MKGNGKPSRRTFEQRLAFELEIWAMTPAERASYVQWMRQRRSRVFTFPDSGQPPRIIE